ncbi:MAG TPA: hypothetical protein VFZ20_00245, partial [Longimicrobium sp.]
MSDARWDRVYRLIDQIRALEQDRAQAAGDDRALADRMRRELRRYEQHRDQLAPPDRERLLDFIVDDLVGLTHLYAPAPPAAVAEAPDASRALRLVLDAGRTLAESLEYESGLDRLARLCVAWFADACAVHLVQPAARCVANVGRGAASSGLLAALGADPLDADRPDHPVAEAIRRGARVDVP